MRLGFTDLACHSAWLAADNIHAAASRLGSDAAGIHTWKHLVDYMNKLRARHGEPLETTNRQVAELQVAGYDAFEDYLNKLRGRHGEQQLGVSQIVAMRLHSCARHHSGISKPLLCAWLSANSCSRVPGLLVVAPAEPEQHAQQLQPA